MSLDPAPVPRRRMDGRRRAANVLRPLVVLCVVLCVVLLATGSSLADESGLDENAATPTVPWLERRHPEFDALVDGAEIEVLGTGFTWSEGPVWVGGPAEDGGFLLFSDVPENTVHRWTAEGGVEPWIRPSGLLLGGPRSQEPGANGLAVDADGRLLLCQHGDRRVARLTVPPSEGPWLDERAPLETAPVETLADAWEGRRFHSPNDLVVHPNGDVYFTDPPYGLAGGVESELREMEHHGVYRIRAPGSTGKPRVELLHDGLSRPNGIALSPDGGTLYVANSDPEQALWMSWRVTDDGLEDGRVFFDATDQVSEDRPGLPDGMAVDREGRLFATGPGGVWVFSADGTHLGTLRLDAPTANCTFGDDGRSLFVTRDDQLLRIHLNTVGLGFEIPGAPRLRNSIKEAQYSVSPRGGTASLSSMRRRRSSRCASQ